MGERYRIGLNGRNRNGGTVKRRYRTKAVLYGTEVELYVYKRDQFAHINPDRGYVKYMNGKRNKSSIKRAKDMIHRLTRANLNAHGDFKPVFHTLTYAENKKDLKAANKDFTYFIKKLGWEVGYKMKYVCVPEFQKRGAVHYHIIYFNLPFIDKNRLEELWGHGFCNIQSLDDIESPAAYLTKYLTKETMDVRLYGQRAYLTPRGLVRPIISFDDDANLDLYDKMYVKDKKMYRDIKIIKGDIADL